MAKLNDLIVTGDTKMLGKLHANADTATTASSIFDSGNKSLITLNYSAAAVSNPTWLAGWNGYELRGVSRTALTVGYASLLALNSSLTTTNTRSVGVSSWNGGISSGLSYMWGQSFKDTSIGSDTGDLVLAVRAGQYTDGGTELCMMIDGDYYSMGNKVLHAGNYSSYALPLSGGTMTGVLKLKGSMYEDSFTSGALDAQNSNITGVNSIYTADLADSASEGIHFYRTSTTVDSLWGKNGVLYFSPNRTVGSGTSTDNIVLHSANYSSYALPLTGGTVTGKVTVDRLKISSTSGVGHIEFSRDSYNYLYAPGENTHIALCANAELSLANSALVVSKSAVFPGADKTYSLGTSSSIWSAGYINRLHITGNTNATVTTSGTNPAIVFSENQTQPVYIMYSDYDAYRAPAGLKIMGGSDANPAWLEVEGMIYAQGKVKAPTTGSAWIDGQRYERAAYNVQDISDTSSYWPWMRMANTHDSVKKWFSFGTLGTKFYWIGSATTRTENGYDNGMSFDVGNGVLSAPIVNGGRVYTGYDSGESNSVSCSNWFRSNGDTGWYNGDHGCHIRPNTVGSYGSIRVHGGAKGGYEGIHFGASTSGMTVMSIDGSHQGLYQQSTGTWIIYNNGSGNVGVGTSSLVSGFSLTLGGATYIKGKVVVKGSGSSYNEGIRILPASNGWSNVFFSADDTTQGTHNGGWLIGRRGAAGTIGAIGDFTIEEEDSAGANLTIYKNSGGARLRGSLTADGGKFCNRGNTTAADNYGNAAIEIREYAFGGAQDDTWGVAPRLSFHWSGRTTAQIGLASNGWLYAANSSNAGTAMSKIMLENGGTWGISISGNAATATRATTTYTGSMSGDSHAAALQAYFNANKSTTPRDKLTAYYSSAYSNGSMYMGYFLNGYDANPYGGFFVAHYDAPYYVGISNGTFTQWGLSKVGHTHSEYLPLSGGTMTGNITLGTYGMLGFGNTIPATHKEVTSFTPEANAVWLATTGGGSESSGICLDGASIKFWTPNDGVIEFIDSDTAAGTNYASVKFGTVTGGTWNGSTIAVAYGGTGITSNPSMLVDLGSTSAASVFAASPRPGVTGTLGVANGGTGITSWTANRLIYASSATALTTSSHYISNTAIGVNLTSAPTNGTLEVEGVSAAHSFCSTKDTSSYRLIYGKTRMPGMKYDYGGNECLIISSGNYSSSSIHFYTSNRLVMNDTIG